MHTMPKVPPILSPVMGVCAALALQYFDFRTLVLDQSDMMRWKLLQEWKSLAVFGFMFVCATTYILTTLASCVWSVAFFLAQVVIIRLGYCSSMLRIWNGLKRLENAGRMLYYFGVTLFACIRWDQKLLSSMEKFQNREFEAFRTRTDIFVYPNWSRTWWMSLISVYHVEISDAVILSCCGIVLYLFVNCLIPILIWAEAAFSACIRPDKSDSPLPPFDSSQQDHPTLKKKASKKATVAEKKKKDKQRSD